MQRLLGLVLFLAFAIHPALPQQATPSSPSTTTASEAPATKEDIEKLFAAIHLREQMHNIMEMSSKQSMQATLDMLKKRLPDLSQNDLDRITSVSNRVLKDFDTDGILDDIVPVYQRHLTKEDVAAMLAFYETPTGQKILREQPAMTKEAMKAVQPRMEKMMANMMDQVEQMAKDMKSSSQSSDAAKK